MATILDGPNLPGMLARLLPSPARGEGTGGAPAPAR